MLAAFNIALHKYRARNCARKIWMPLTFTCLESYTPNANIYAGLLLMLPLKVSDSVKNIYKCLVQFWIIDAYSILRKKWALSKTKTLILLYFKGIVKWDFFFHPIFFSTMQGSARKWHENITSPRFTLLISDNNYETAITYMNPRWKLLARLCRYNDPTFYEKKISLHNPFKQ